MKSIIELQAINEINGYSAIGPDKMLVFIDKRNIFIIIVFVKYIIISLLLIYGTV